jgi:hypothetical protein
MLHVGGKSKLKQLKTLDWMGIFLFSTGLVVFLIGMNWGGSAYPWKSGHVLGALFAGFGTLVAFCFWEAYAPGLEYPLIPLRLFRNIEYDANVACASLAAIVYYANSIIWPTMVSSLFTTDITKIGWLSVSLRNLHQHGISSLTTHSAPLAVVFSSDKYSEALVSAIFRG